MLILWVFKYFITQLKNFRDQLQLRKWSLNGKTNSRMEAQKGENNHRKVVFKLLALCYCTRLPLCILYLRLGFYFFRYFAHFCKDLFCIFDHEQKPRLDLDVLNFQISNFEYLLLFSSGRRTWKNQNKYSLF